MTTLSCLIVEDEPLAAGILEEYVLQTPQLRLVGICPDAEYAAEALQQSEVAVLLLDIHLPGRKGLDFLRSLPQPPQVILTTAYQEYALESYEFGVVDYLLKPIDFERFRKAVQKLRFPVAPQQGSTRSFHFFNVGKKMVRVWPDEITAMESLKEYVRIFLADGTDLVTKGALSDFELLFADHQMLRVHRSFAVAKLHVTAYTATTVFIGKRCIPIGRQYKNQVLNAFHPNLPKP